MSSVKEISIRLRSLIARPHSEFKDKDPINNWVSEVVSYLEANKSSQTNMLLISDIDDTLFNTSLRSYERMISVCGQNGVKILDTPSIETFRKKGQRSTFEPVFKNIGLNYDSVRTQMETDPNYYEGLPSLLNINALNHELPNNALIGGYLTSRPMQLKEITEIEFKKNNFPAAPILFRKTQEEKPEVTLKNKIRALKTLRAELDKHGLKNIEIAYIDDYEGNIEKIIKECKFNIRTFLLRNDGELKSRLSKKTWDEIAQQIGESYNQFWLGRISYPPAANLDRKTTRQKMMEFAFTSPTGVGDVLENLFKAGLYPSKSIKMIDQLDKSFFDRWFLKYVPAIHEKYKENSASALFALYFFTRDIYMPLRILHMLSILQEVGPNDILHLMARDTLPELIFASQLKKSEFG